MYFNKSIIFKNIKSQAIATIRHLRKIDLFAKTRAECQTQHTKTRPSRPRARNHPDLACILFVLIPRLNETSVRVLLGLLLVRFLPGYSLITALFPRRDDSGGSRSVSGSSIAIVPLTCLGLNYTHYGIQLVPVLLGRSSTSLMSFWLHLISVIPLI